MTMKKKKQNRYIVLDLGDKISVDTLFSDNDCTLALEVHREKSTNPYSRYYVQRVIQCRFDRGKLYKL
jgi:hypothetical protein